MNQNTSAKPGTYPAPATHSPCVHEADLSILKSTMVDVKENLKQITELLTSNAVLQEQVASLSRQTQARDKRLSAVEQSLATIKGGNRWVDKVLWAILGVAISALFVSNGGLP